MNSAEFGQDLIKFTHKISVVAGNGNAATATAI